MNANQRADRWAGIWVGLCVAALVAFALWTQGCATNPSTGKVEFDPITAEREMGLALETVGDLLLIAEDDADGDGERDKPEEADLLREMAFHLRTIQGGLAAYNQGKPVPVDLGFAIDAAIQLADQVVDPEDRLYLVIGKAALRRLKAYLPREGA